MILFRSEDGKDMHVRLNIETYRLWILCRCNRHINFPMYGVIETKCICGLTWIFNIEDEILWAKQWMN